MISDGSWAVTYLDQWQIIISDGSWSVVDPDQWRILVNIFMKIRFHRRVREALTYGRWSKSSTVPLSLTVTLLTSLCSPSRRKRRNSWASCWLYDAQWELHITHIYTFYSCSPTKAAYLYPTNLGAYLWIWVLNSKGLTTSLLDNVHMICISLANSTRTETLTCETSAEGTTQRPMS